MSYILDALRRAEVERARERGKVPGLHDPAPVATPSTPSDASPAGRRTWIAVGGVVVIAAIALGWFAKDHGDAPPPVAALGVPSNTGATSARMAAPVATLPEPAVAASAPRAEQAPAAIGPARSETAAVPPRELAPVPALPRSETSPRTTAPVTPAPALAPSPAPAPSIGTAPPVANGAVASRVYEPNELPDDIRRALPPLTFGGAMYSDTPSARLLIVNGQVVHEGEQVAKGLTLEQIHLKTAVMVFRGYRYLVSY